MQVSPAALADELAEARARRSTIATLTSRYEMDLDDAYAVQAAGIGLRLEAGETIVGGKLGFTSRAMQQAMGVDHPNRGWLTDAMLLHDTSVPLDRLIHPKIEPEIAFLLGRDLEPPVTPADVIDATVAVAACLEVVDSRYDGFRFSAFDNIADNSSSGMVALGDPIRPEGIRLDMLGLAVYADGELFATAAGAAALDHPAAAVAWMANHSERPLQAGHVVISGGLTSPIDLHPGTVVTAEFDHLGTIELAASHKE